MRSDKDHSFKACGLNNELQNKPTRKCFTQTSKDSEKTAESFESDNARSGRTNKCGFNTADRWGPLRLRLEGMAVLCEGSVL